MSRFTATVRRPLNVGVLVSGTGGNLGTVIEFAVRRPDLVSAGLVATDRPGCAAAELARSRGLPVLGRDFTAACGRASEAVTERDRIRYAHAAEAFHDELDDAIRDHERRNGALDLLVLAYSRWVHGRLLRRFSGRMINQHPADLTLLDPSGRRVLVGNNPVLKAIELGETRTRTSTFLVDAGHDTGAIVCQGPWVDAQVDELSQSDADQVEALQKRLSDRPALVCALTLFAFGMLAVDADAVAPDGSALLRIAGRRMPFGGIDLARDLEHLPAAVRAVLEEPWVGLGPRANDA